MERAEYIRTLKEHIREYSYLDFLLKIKCKYNETGPIPLLTVPVGDRQYSFYFAADECYSNIIIEDRAQEVFDMFFSSDVMKSAFYTKACAYAKDNIMHLFVPVCIQSGNYTKCSRIIQSVIELVSEKHPVYLIGASGDITDDLYYYLFKVEIKLPDAHINPVLECHKDDDSRILTVKEIKDFIKNTVINAVKEELNKKFNEYILPTRKESYTITEPYWNQYPFPKPWEVTSTYFTC